MSVEIYIDFTTTEKGFIVDDWGYDHRIICDNVQIVLTEEQLIDLSEELNRYVECDI